MNTRFFLVIFLIPLFWLSAVYGLGGFAAQAQQLPQQLNITSPPNPVGAGARAAGMAGAFTAVADDATAASWNPAGLSQLRKPEFSFTLSYHRRREDYSARRHPEAEGAQKSLMRDLNYMSAAWPFNLFDRNMIVSLNYQRMYEFERNVRTDYFSRSFSPQMLSYVNYFQEVDFRQQGGLKAFSPAYAVQITPELSFGLTLNIWTDKLFWSNGWESHTRAKGTVSMSGITLARFKTVTRNRYYRFEGLNAHLGFLWQVNHILSIGAVVKTPFTAQAKHEMFARTSTWSLNNIKTKGRPLRIREDIDLEMPLSYALGFAFRFTDAFTVSLDFHRTEWSRFIIENSDGNRYSPVTGRRSHETDVHASHQIRLGAEVLWILQKTVVPFRFGIFYDPEPSEKNPEDYYGISLGTGVSMGRIVLDVAYQLRRGSNVEGEVLGIPGSDADVTQHMFLLSTIFYF